MVSGICGLYEADCPATLGLLACAGERRVRLPTPAGTIQDEIRSSVPLRLRCRGRRSANPTSATKCESYECAVPARRRSRQRISSNSDRGERRTAATGARAMRRSSQCSVFRRRWCGGIAAGGSRRLPSGGRRRAQNHKAATGGRAVRRSFQCSVFSLQFSVFGRRWCGRIAAGGSRRLPSRAEPRSRDRWSRRASSISDRRSRIAEAKGFW